jgi:cell division protein FtsB
MTTQPTINEVVAKWSDLLNQAFVSIITLEKSLQAAQLQIAKMTANEARLIENIQDLESELVALMPEKGYSTLSPELAKRAEEGRKIIQGE